MDLYILERQGLYFVVQGFGRTIYTYKVCETKKDAEESLKLIEKLYGF